MLNYSVIQKSQLEGAKRLDAEYYQSEYLDIEKRLSEVTNKRIKDFAVNIARKFKPQKDQYFNYIEISEVDLRDGDFKAEQILGNNAPDRAQKVVKSKDVIISTVRPNRNAVSLIEKEHEDFVASSGFCVIEAKKVSSEYLFVYLKTKHVVKLLDRLTSASMYPAVAEEDIMNLPFYITNEEKIKKIVKEVFSLIKNSKFLYSQAEKFLLEELGLKNFGEKESLCTVVNLSEVRGNKRMDAEFFNSDWQAVEKIIKDLKIQKLGDLAEMTKGVEPGAEAYVESPEPPLSRGQLKLFIRVSSISKDGIIDKDQKYISEDLYNEYKEDYEPQAGEILLTKDASIGVACLVRKPVEGVVSSGVMRLKLKEKINPEYLALVLNSMVGRLQAERDAGGSIIAHWKPEQIKNLVVPILSSSTQSKIGDLLLQSYQARKKAKELLEEAKLKVEEMIEKKEKNNK